uniref:Cytochrome P450 n=1 Tax=Oryza brachyantha TaxID=4533 RepID=J3LAC4_ORYBR
MAGDLSQLHLLLLLVALMAAPLLFLSFRPVREDELGRLLRAVEAATAAPPTGTVNLTDVISTYVADSTVRAIIGSRRLKDRDAYLRMLDELFTIMPGMSLPDLFPSSRLAMLLSRAPGRIESYRRRLRRIMDSIIDEHQERRDATTSGDDDDDEDLVDVLLRLQKEVGAQYPLTTENIKTVMLDIFGGGSETSATTLEWVMAELMRSPGAMRKAQEEVRRALAAAGHDTVTEDILPSLHYLKLVVKETLRLHPLPLVLRRCESPRKVLGYDVPAGATVLVNSWAIGRDPAHWDAPDEFTPERFEAHDGGGGGARDFRGADFEFIPFGAGRRMCPGMAFGLVHVELALAALLFHFDWSLPGGMPADELDMTETSGLTTRRRLHLLVVARPHAPLPKKY